MPTLRFTQPEFHRQSLELSDGTFSLGRSSRNQIILEDSSISKMHAEIRVHGTEVIVRDCGSQNGSFVDRVRVQTQSGVRHGQRIRFGHVEVQLDLGEPRAGDATDITAVSLLRESVARTDETGTTSARVPARFTPVTASSADSATVSLPNPKPADPLPAPEIRTQASPSPGAWSARFRRFLGAGTLFLAVPWLMKR
jgi:predicted component of type VI protein secretion system